MNRRKRNQINNSGVNTSAMALSISSKWALIGVGTSCFGASQWLAVSVNRFSDATKYFDQECFRKIPMPKSIACLVLKFR